jgi:hypothetical protein
VDVPVVPVTLVGLRLHVNPVVGETVATRFVVPPAGLLTVIWEVPVWPARIVTLVGFALNVRPEITLYVTVAEWDSDPLVPVTDTWKVPWAVNVHDRVAVPEPVTLVGDTVHEVLLVARLTIPANPFKPVIVTVDMPATPTLVVTGVLAAIVKSWTTNVTVTEWDRAPLVPVTDTCLLPIVVNVQESVALPEPVTLVGATEQEVLLVARPTTPAKPFWPVTVILEVPAALTFTLTLVGLAAIVKSCTTKVTVTLWERLPLVPVTPTWTVETAVNVHDRVELPDVVTLDGVSVHAVLLLARLTVPVNPLSGVIVIVEDPAAFTFTGTLVGLALIAKSTAAV